MKFNVLHNFISPVTGRVLCEPGYILLGDNAGIATASPILIDIELKIINLRHDLDHLAASSFIVGFRNSQMPLPNAQILSDLIDGVMFNTAGIVSTSGIIPITVLPDLTKDYLWVGDDNGRPAEKKILSRENLPKLRENKIWVGNHSDRPTEANKPKDGKDGDDGNIDGSGGGGGGGLFGGVAGGIAGGVAGGITGHARTRGGGSRSTTNVTNIYEGAESVSGPPTIIFNANITTTGGRITDLAPSPGADFDAVTANFVWDLLNDQVIIEFEQ